MNLLYLAVGFTVVAARWTGSPFWLVWRTRGRRLRAGKVQSRLQVADANPSLSILLARGSTAESNAGHRDWDVQRTIKWDHFCTFAPFASRRLRTTNSFEIILFKFTATEPTKAVMGKFLQALFSSNWNTDTHFFPYRYSPHFVPSVLHPPVPQGLLNTGRPFGPILYTLFRLGLQADRNTQSINFLPNTHLLVNHFCFFVFFRFASSAYTTFSLALAHEAKVAIFSLPRWLDTFSLQRKRKIVRKKNP